MTAEELEALAERFGVCAGKVIKENATYENVSPVAVSIMVSTMLFLYVASETETLPNISRFGLIEIGKDTREE